MSRLDVNEYRKMYLTEVEEHLMAHKESIPNFTTENMHRAIMTEMNRADESTWELDVPDDRGMAIKEAEGRCENYIRTHVDCTP
jgi:hypothetical protein